MPTLELISPATNPDGSRLVRAPGGYESWTFAASSSRGRTHLIAGLHLGHPADREYARRYWAYRRWPTRVAPPVPLEYPSVSMTVVEDEKVLWRMHDCRRGVEASAATDRGNVRIGSSHFETAADGAIHLRMRVHGERNTASADLVFRIRAGAKASEVVDGPHHALLVAPLCDVDGELELVDSGVRFPRSIRFSGLGAHEHRFGMRMHDERVLCGATMLGEHAVMLHAFGSRDYVTDEIGRQVCIDALDPIRVPQAIRGEQLELANPRSIDSQCVLFDASSGEDRSQMLCETLTPARPSFWSLLLRR